MSANCPHPPTRLYAWYALDCREPNGKILVVCCLACKSVLRGGC
jgi:hypothetical protein